jgi:predicted transcriptional regulator
MTNKRRQVAGATISGNININILLSLHLCFRSTLPVRTQYHLNTLHVVILVSCYLYCKYVNPSFNVTQIAKFNTSFNYNKTKRYIQDLVSSDILTLARLNEFTLTDKGVQIIQEISDSSYNVIYEFCNKYSLEL